MSIYIPLEPQVIAGQNFLRNYGLNIYGLWDKGVKVQDDVIVFQRNFFVYGNISAYISLEHQFNADQSFLGNYGLNMYGFRDTVG